MVHELEYRNPSAEERDGQGGHLSPEERRNVVAILAIGSDRKTAARFLGIARRQIDESASREAEFARALTRAEAAAEIAHAKCLHAAIQDPKNWRAAVWWLERMRPDKYGKREPAVPDEALLARWSEQVAAAIAEEVSDEATRRRVLERLRVVANETA